MEGRARRYGARLSPERSRVWTEPPPKHQIHQPQEKVPVVYYLCKGRHLEHPHFIEVPISSSSGGLYLKDVISRLVVLRGKRMPTMYSWSCKRSYKSGFVWQDLSEDDLILPAHGNEYILKGSELLDRTPPDRLQNSGNNQRLQNYMPSLQDLSRVPEPSSSYSSPVSTVLEGKSPSSPGPVPPLQEDDSVILPHQSSSQVTGFPNFGKRRVLMLNGAQDASTQTEDRGERREQQQQIIHTNTASIGDDLTNMKYSSGHQNEYVHQSDDSIKESSPSRTPSSVSSGAKVDTLESLIKAEVSKFNSFRIVEEEEVAPMKAKMKWTNPLLQLLTCGSTLVKDHYSLGFIQTYKPRFLNMRFGPTFPSSMTLRELDYVSEGSRVMRLGTGRRDSFSRNLGENYLMHKVRSGEVSPSFNYTPLFNRDIKPVLSGACMSPILDARSSPAEKIHSKSPSASSFNASYRNVDVTSPEGSSMQKELFQEETERTIKIEEKLTSGARIIIQSRVPHDYNDNCCGS